MEPLSMVDAPGDAELDLAVTCGLVSAFKTSGQRCVSAGRLLVHENLIDAYAERLERYGRQEGA